LVLSFSEPPRATNPKNATAAMRKTSICFTYRRCHSLGRKDDARVGGGSEVKL
jgi:hypothetical protein